MTNKEEVKAVKALVDDKFSDYTVEPKIKSPNGHHFVLTKDGVKKHLKVVNTELLAKEGVDEVALLSSITSNNVIALEEHGALGDQYTYLLFPHIDGKTLDELTDKDGWTNDDLKALAKDVTNAIKDMAAGGVTHRDLKPKNIIKEASSGKYIVLDLGIGYYINKPDRDNTKYPKGKGSKYYSAPEQIWANDNLPYEITPAADQFSLGVMLHELATGVHPYVPPEDSKVKNYAQAVTGSVVPTSAKTLNNKIDEEISLAIDRMLATKPSQRFLDFDLMRIAWGESVTPSKKTSTKILLTMPSKSKQEFIDYLKTQPNSFPSGVVLSCSSDKEDWVEPLNELGKEILIDPQTHQLPKGAVTVANRLGLKPQNFTALDLYKLKDELILGALKMELSKHAKRVILPYFTIEQAGGDYLKLSKDIWTSARTVAKNAGYTTQELYAGILIPTHLILDESARHDLMSQILANYDLDGIYVIFENNGTAGSVATTSDKDYIRGVGEYITFFESVFGKAIIARSDISVLPFLNQSDYALGWSKSSTHFKLSGSGRQPKTYKMKYFSRQLFTFIEEKTMIQSIITFGHKDKLDCECDYCKAAQPLDSSYTPQPLPERHHFYAKLAELESETQSLDRDERKAFYLDLLNSAQDGGDKLKSDSGGVVSNEIVPDYKGLISIIGE